MKNILIICCIGTTLLWAACQKDNDAEEKELPIGWEEIASPNELRNRHSAVLMADGKVMISGGYKYDGDKNVSINTAEVYDPKTDTWDYVADMVNYRVVHNMILLSDERILAFGGYNAKTANTLSNGEIYDPKTNTWTLTSTIREDCNVNQPMLPLPSGKILIPATQRVYIFDPDMDTFEIHPGSELTANHYRGSAAVSISDTSFMLIGGGGLRHHQESYIITQSGKRTNFNMNGAHSWLPALLMENGNILITRGEYGLINETFDMELMEWRENPSMLLMVFGKLFPGKPGKVIAFGDIYMQEYDIKQNTWSRLDRPVAFWGNTFTVPAVQFPDGRIFITGGWDLAVEPTPGVAHERVQQSHEKSYIYTPQ